jgi:hypothetical protein
MTELYRRDKSDISRHINNIFNEGELARESVVAKNTTAQKEGDLSHYQHLGANLKPEDLRSGTC